MIRLLFDLKQKRPACILLQAARKCDWARLRELFSPTTWLDHPTQDMQVVSGTKEQWMKVIDGGCGV